MTQPQVVPGQTLAGRYRLQRELGRGGMGAVWRAEHLTLRSAVAVKVLAPELAEGGGYARFLAEARSAANVNNPHVVRIFDYGVDRDVAFLVMELLEGESLHDRLRREGRLDAPTLARIVRQVARGIGAAHRQNIVHRDLKPDNIFLVAGADELWAKVLDFGIAKVARGLDESSMHTQTGTVLGTLHYMSPEQLQDSKRVGPATDVWSLGIVAFECLLGRRPFEAQNPGAIVLKIVQGQAPAPSQLAAAPPGFDEWFARAAHRDPHSRFRSIVEAAEALEVVCHANLAGARGHPARPPAKTLPTLRAPEAPRPDSWVAPMDSPADSASPVSSKPSPSLPKARSALWGVAVAGVVAAVVGWLRPATNAPDEATAESPGRPEANPAMGAEAVAEHRSASAPSIGTAVEPVAPTDGGLSVRNLGHATARPADQQPSPGETAEPASTAALESRRARPQADPTQRKPAPPGRRSAESTRQPPPPRRKEPTEPTPADPTPTAPLFL